MMTIRKLKALRAASGLSAREFALLLRMEGEHAGRTVRRWESGETEIPGYVSLLCELLQLSEVQDYLARKPERATRHRSKPKPVKLAS